MMSMRPLKASGISSKPKDPTVPRSSFSHWQLMDDTRTNHGYHIVHSSMHVAHDPLP